MTQFGVKIVSQVLDLTINVSGNFVVRELKNIRIKRLIKKLSEELDMMIKNKYQNEIYYNDLFNFLIKNRVIAKLFDNYMDENVYTKEGAFQQVSYYSNLFINTYPDLMIRKKDVEVIIYRTYIFIYEKLTSSSAVDDVKRITENNFQMASIINNQINNLEKKVDDLGYLLAKADSINVTTNQFIILEDYLNNYLDSLKQILIKKKNYYYRKIETFNNQKLDLDSYELLEREKAVLMIGEAGIGKTTEAKYVLTRWFDTASLSEYIPIYLSLSEYGLTFDTIEDGIKKKISRFSNISNHTLKEVFTEKNFLLILDGIDDVLDDEKIEKVLAESLQLIELFPDNYYFLTQRENRLKIGFQKDKIFRICNLNHVEVKNLLTENDITIEIPENYYEIFSNPLFLKAGIEVFKNSSDYMKNSFNRSILLQEIVTLLLGTWNFKKGIRISATALSGFSKIFDAISQLAFENIDRAAYTYLEFDSYLEKHSLNSLEDYQRRIITGGLFRFEDSRVYFSHRHFRDFFIAYYLYQNFEPVDNEKFYFEIAKDIKWHESLIILIGLTDNMDTQDFLLDGFLKSNLSLYVQAVNSKNELINEIGKLSFEEYTKRYLEKFVKTYQDIIDIYFSPIKRYFNPYKYFDDEEIDLKVQIQAYLSEDKSQLSYTLMAFPSNENLEIVEYKDFNSFKINGKHAFSQFSKMGRYRGYSSSFISLKKVKREMDGSRALALDQIRSELSTILKEKKLIPSLVVDIEIMKVKLKKLSITKNIDNIDLIVDELENYIEDETRLLYSNAKLQQGFVEIELNGVKVIKLLEKIKKYKGKNISISSFTMPNGDISFNSPVFDGTVASRYSKELKLDMIKKFFSWTQDSYREMIIRNFPNLQQDLFHFKMYPYKTKIVINEKMRSNVGKQDLSLTTYEIPVINEIDTSPELVESDQSFTDNSYFQEIQEGFRSRPDLETKISYRSIAFTTLIIHGKSYKGIPLTDNVYSLIHEDLNRLLGNISK